MRIILLVGPPGSGKSTRASQLVSEGYTHINQDLQGKVGHMELFNKTLQAGGNLVIDRLNFNVEQRSRYTIPAKKAGYHIRFEIFHVPREVCLERCMAREGHPTINGKTAPGRQDNLAVSMNRSLSSHESEEKRRQANSALSTFFSKYERPSDLEADEIIRHGWDSPNKTEVIWCDLDNTLCNTAHRNHFMDRAKGKPNWKAFFDGMVDDSVNTWCANILDRMYLDFPIVYSSGRPDSYRSHTENWLRRFDLDYHKHLFMRSKNDFRQDDIVKEIILEFEVFTRYKVLFALDDRAQVVKKLREHGVTVLQCDYGDF